MRWVLLPGLVVQAAMLAPAAQEGGEALPALEARVREWVGLREEIANERRSWDDTRPRLEAEIELLGRERDALRQEVDEAGRRDAMAKSARVAAVRERDEVRTLLDGLIPVLDRVEALLGAWPQRLPAELRAPLDPVFGELPTDPRAAAQAASVGARFQRVFALYAEIERLQNGLHLVNEVVEIPGVGKREVDVLYVGLSRAFAVAPDDSWAGVGAPGNRGWAWESRPALAGSIREAISVARRDRAARLVPLPIKVLEVSP